MNRRKFFKWLGVGSVAAVVAPSALLVEGPAYLTTPKPPVEWATNGIPTAAMEYAEYTSFSAFTIASSVDDCVSDAAQELAHRSGLMLNEMVKHVDNRI